jgi:hypothetical protein
MARAEFARFEAPGPASRSWGSVPYLDPIEVLTYAAGSTERLRLGCAVFVTSLHSPGSPGQELEHRGPVEPRPPRGRRRGPRAVLGSGALPSVFQGHPRHESIRVVGCLLGGGRRAPRGRDPAHDSGRSRAHREAPVPPDPLLATVLSPTPRWADPLRGPWLDGRGDRMCLLGLSLGGAPAGTS